MGSRPPSLLLLFLTSLLLTWQCARGESSYIIDTVGLTILPRSTVQSGTQVSIGCQASVILSNISHMTYHFLLTRNDVPIHSYNTTEDSVVYELNPARAADSGNYECQVTVKDKSKRSIIQKLGVTGLQTPRLYLSNVSPYESEEFTATCSASEEKGPLKFTFYQRFMTGEPEKMKQLETSGNYSDATLKLRHIGNCFLSCDYEINLISGSIRSSRSDEIEVIVKVLNIKPIMNVLPSLTVFEGDVVDIICKVVDIPLKNIEVFLTKGRRVLKKSPNTALSHLITIQEGDSGEFVCKAEWGNVQKESYITITVKELFSKPRLTVDPIEIFEGDRFKLTCSVSIYIPEKINNETMEFSFYKDNTKLMIKNETLKYSFYKDNTLHTNAEAYIRAVNLEKNGNYTCKAQSLSLIHNFVKESQKLVIKAKVPVSKPVMSVVGGMLFLGKDFQLLCQSSRGTLPIMYTLHIPNRRPEHKTVSKTGEQAIFSLPAILKGSDLSNFQCHAKNSQRRPLMIGLGQQLLRSTSIIEPVSTPMLTITPSAGDISEGQSVSLICSVQSGSPPINFTWYHTETDVALASVSTDKREESFRIHNVRGEHRGRYYCVSTNLAKETKYSPEITFGVKLAGWKKGLIAAFCITLILALILVIAFKKRLFQFERKRSAKLSVKSASTKTERLSLTQAEVIEAANVTPGIMGKSVWSEHVSGSESDDQNSVIISEKSEPQYTEVQVREADPNRAPVKKGTDTVYSEVRNSQQGVPEPADGVSVEYAQLNHDNNRHSDHSNHSNHGDHSADGDHIAETDNSVSTDTGDQGEGTCDPAPDC
ncbi:platelet endothelial cell adhesion molecule [Melanotaenia boesemani]|uniref:platelet endothelial cell adhesion molecule n=1 Tax=Melanotaenia boesemani TaxID=1250792 RepID=UPI001C05AEDE|nr:platelet endothelial cell adhesion molecule [Melanotaenia boesemani]